MFLLTFGRCGKSEWRQNAATDALVDMVRKLTFGRWGDIAGKMHTLGRWGILFSLGMSVRVVFCSGAGGSIKKDRGGVLRSVVLGKLY